MIRHTNHTIDGEMCKRLCVQTTHQQRSGRDDDDDGGVDEDETENTPPQNSAMTTFSETRARERERPSEWEGGAFQLRALNDRGG